MAFFITRDTINNVLLHFRHILIWFCITSKVVLFKVLISLFRILIWPRKFSHNFTVKCAKVFIAFSRFALLDFFPKLLTLLSGSEIIEK